MKRKAYFAGKFYPQDKENLLFEINNLYTKAEAGKKEALAIITPHAGYVYSGEVAASAFSQINAKKRYNNIFILASSHRIYFDGASTYNIGNYETPLGEVKVNVDLCNSLIKNHEFFSYIPEAHFQEHSIEVQLPFLQVHLNYDFQIVPIIIGADNIDAPQEIAQALMPYFNDDNLFVVSSDFSHYPDYSLASTIDQETADLICTGDVDNLVYHLSKYLIKEFKNNLDTCLCGSSAVNVLMRLAKDKCDYNKIIYQNSGDLDFGDRSSVVGYWAISLTKKDNLDFSLSSLEKETLLNIAKESLKSKVYNIEFKLEDHISEYGENLNARAGVFVSLYKNKNLRACLGVVVADESIVQLVARLARATTYEDHRFLDIRADELNDIEIEISILTPLKKISSIDDIILGKHGVCIIKNDRKGVSLPKVAVEAGWSKQEMLAMCSCDKMGLEKDAWKDSEIFVFETIVFSDSEFLNL